MHLEGVRGLLTDWELGAIEKENGVAMTSHTGKLCLK